MMTITIITIMICLIIMFLLIIIIIDNRAAETGNKQCYS